MYVYPLFLTASWCEFNLPIKSFIIDGPRSSGLLSLCSNPGSLASPPPLQRRVDSTCCHKVVLCAACHTIFGHAEFCSGKKHSKFGRNLMFQMEAALTWMLVGSAKVISSIECANMFSICP
ncbi:hypothetical protein ILYODFUR_032557 [Ilyodon furcidens]|uniref:Uncharacterized protein n=1 Tax=Ilyodon furcidens TaxID=33524 RepID=A0ABV0T5G3_9TELE